MECTKMGTDGLVGEQQEAVQQADERERKRKQDAAKVQVNSRRLSAAAVHVKSSTAQCCTPA